MIVDAAAVVAVSSAMCPPASAAASAAIYVSLGQFSLIRLERDTQLLIPVYDYCMPQKECACDGGSCEEDPCELFRHVKFPVNEFFPPDRVGPNGEGCGCCG